MHLNHGLRSTLLGSIEANRLVLLCGAGLSIPAPSNLLSAAGVSRACFDKWLPVEPLLDPALREDVDRLAGHFYAAGQFESVFIARLVPWNDLVGDSNEGHAAVADLLITRSAFAALSANFDLLIEQWSQQRKVAMRGALNGQEAVNFSSDTSPLVKFHGCLHREREKTLWTAAQLGEAAISERVSSCSDWLRLSLPGKDLVVVGFWTDWGYLNDVLKDALSLASASSVTVIDILDGPALEAKAPDLWRTLHDLSTSFTHVQASGTEVLEELRTGFSQVWARKFYHLGKPLIEQEGKAYPLIGADPGLLTGAELYHLRRDAEGVPSSRAALKKEPGPEAAQAALAHLLLMDAGAARRGVWFERGGKTVRVVQGGGQGLATVRERYREPPGGPEPDLVICAGAAEFGVPGRLIASGYGASTMRPAPGGGAKWLTLEEARGELSI
jgi:hypothetical protein